MKALSAVSHMVLDGEPVAAIPMRLNGDSLSDLVILRRGHSAITVTPSSTQNNFVVNSVADNGPGTLREAIMMANANVGADQISFDLGVTQTINLMSPLPAIADQLTIDGSTQAGFSGSPIVELNCLGAGDQDAGLVINAANCTIRSLVINRVQGPLGQGNGILISSNNAIIEGNFIGTNVAGNSASGNEGVGVRVANTSGVLIGGSGAAARNLISGNVFGGVELSGLQSTNINIFGNFIGCNAAGTAALSAAEGVAIVSNANGNMVGGAAAGQRNLISGNTTGITVAGGGNLVQGNFVGLDVTGNSALDNTESGITVIDSLGSTIGGTVVGARNIIAASSTGIGMFGTGGNNVQGNFIGTNAGGTAALPNDLGGIVLMGATLNQIGGTTAGSANLVAFNGDAGIRVLGGTNNAILGNSFMGNSGLGINLGDDGVTPNDALDADPGPNDFQNFPVLTNAARAGGNTRVVGTLNSEPNTQYRIEFFANANCDGSGNGEGERFLGSTTVMTDVVTGAANFNLLLPTVTPGQSVTATATDPDNNTSEFSPCVSVLAGPGTADLSVTKTAAPAQVQAGTLTTYTITVRNLGPDAAANVTLNESTPANTTFRSINTPPGWVCNTPTPGAAGNITCTIASLTPGTSEVITLVVRVNAETANGTVIKNLVKVTTSTTDLNPQNDSASTNITVFNNCVLNCPSGISRNIEANQCGATVSYTPPTSSGACGSVVCLPPSGSFFQRGTTTVNCSANSGPGCSFTVTINDTQPPTINCPANVIAQESPAGSGVATVTYASPTANDNCQGVATVCAPPSGSSFPLGITAVNCRATDVGGNNANCSFNITVQGGPPQLEVSIPGGTALVFGGITPVPVRRKPVKDKNNPCSIFTVANNGFSPVEIILDSVVRVGADVDSRRIGDANEGGLYSVRRILAGGGEVLVPIGGSVVIGIGERVNFCVKFNAVLPIVPTSANNIPATLVVADRTNSRVTFRVTRGTSFSVNTIANVAGDLVLIDPENTRRAPVLSFERIGNEFILTFSLFDANQDVQRMKVELLDGNGAVAVSFDIDLVAPVRERNLIRGQSFTVIQKFTGANDNPQITAVRLTVSDALTSVSGTVNVTGSSATSLVDLGVERQSAVVLPLRRIRR
jgi:uncharacterized repeat protein (TIGR01451 family)